MWTIPLKSNFFSTDKSWPFLQVKAPAQPQGFLTSVFPLSCPRMLLRNSARPPSTSSCRKPSHLKAHPAGCSRVEPPLDCCPRGLRLASCGRESMGSDGTCSTPPGSSCYSSQRSSPAGLSVNWYEPAITSETSISCLLLEEEEPETNVDTGCAVKPQATLGVSSLVTLSTDLKHGLAESQLTSEAKTQPSRCHSQHQQAQVDEFFIWLFPLTFFGKVAHIYMDAFIQSDLRPC